MASGWRRSSRKFTRLPAAKFNIGSPKQLQVVLFDEQKLPRLRQTKTGASTDADVLEELARASHPLPAKIIEYRQYAKLKNTYVDALPQLIHPATGRVHASFNQSVAATGRLSSSDPNLQNIPIRTARRARNPLGVSSRPRRLAAASRPIIRKSSCACWPICRATRRCEPPSIAMKTFTPAWPARCMACALDAVTSEMRRVAKAVNFGVIYGQSPFGLSKMLGIDQDEAAEFIRAYFAGYPGISRFLETILADCRRDGYVSTILGRRRSIRGVRPPDVMRPSAGRRRQRISRRPPARGKGAERRIRATRGLDAGMPSRTTCPRRTRRCRPPCPVPQRNLAERTAINTVDPRLRRRYDQAGDDQHPSPPAIRKMAGTHVASNPRRIGFRSPREELDRLVADGAAKKCRA